MTITFPFGPKDTYERKQIKYCTAATRGQKCGSKHQIGWAFTLYFKKFPHATSRVSPLHIQQSSYEHRSLNTRHSNKLTKLQNWTLLVGANCSQNAVRDIRTDHYSTVAAEIFVGRFHIKLVRRLWPNTYVICISFICPSIEIIFLSFLSLETLINTNWKKNRKTSTVWTLYNRHLHYS